MALKKVAYYWLMMTILSSGYYEFFIFSLNFFCVGNFNVSKHIQTQGSSAYKAAYKVLFGLGLMIMVRGLLLADL